MQIKDATFVITGGASGLGEATTRRFHQAGANVVIADVQVSTAEKLAAELGKGALFCRTDVTSETDAQTVIDLASAHFGALQGLINCAGIAPAEKVLGKRGPHRLDSFSNVIQINLIGTFNMIRLAALAMSRGVPNATGERGVIINTASIAGYEGQIGQAAYASAKGGIISMTLPIARELAGHGIRVVAIAPGLFATPMLQTMRQDVQDALVKTTLFPPRLGQAVEYAQLAQHVVENEMLNGCIIRLDGAVRLV